MKKETLGSTETEKMPELRYCHQTWLNVDTTFGTLNSEHCMSVEKNVITVTELTKHIKHLLETGFPRVWVQGEISNFKHHSSGHLYFTLKDESAQCSAVLWRNRAAQLLFQPEDGMKVIARGALTVYPPRGNYQIDVEQLQPMGVGELQIAFERLKQKLAAEGLFDQDHKKPIPEFPETIGIITSETGAALQDIRSVLSRRNPAVQIILAPVRVQGAGAAEEIADAIMQMNTFPDIDVLIVGRGGGSLEDLWAFNEEIVARAIFASRIPVISAVGHEIDFSIADLAADLRAPTPSAAAELAVKDRGELLEDIANFCYTMHSSIENMIQRLQERTMSLLSSYAFNRPRDLVREYAQHVDEMERNMNTSLNFIRRHEQQQYHSLRSHLLALNPEEVLKRGYSIVRKEGKIISRARMLHHAEKAAVQFHDGEVAVTIEKGK